MASINLPRPPVDGGIRFHAIPGGPRRPNPGDFDVLADGDCGAFLFIENVSEADAPPLADRLNSALTIPQSVES